MKAIIKIQTVNGETTIKGEKIGKYLAVTRKNKSWGVTHVASGYSVAWLTSEVDAISIATALEVSTADFSWVDPSQMPEKTKQIVHRLFSALCKSVKFTNQG